MITTTRFRHPLHSSAHIFGRFPNAFDRSLSFAVYFPLVFYFKQNDASGSHLQGDDFLGGAATARDLVRFAFFCSAS